MCISLAANVAEAAENTAPPVCTATQRAQKPTYRLPNSERRTYNYDAKTAIQGYVQLVGLSYTEALNSGMRFKTAIDAFLTNPNDDTLIHARNAWINARRTWMQTEAFRFYDGPIDITDIETCEPGPAKQLDGNRIDPAIIDQVEGNPTSGIVNDMKLALTRRTLIDRQRGDADPTTTGWHALEFLLWGESPKSGGPGDRPPTDYLGGQPNNDRRRTYLKLTTDMLVEDLRYLAESWAPKMQRNYAAAFRLLNQREAMGRILNGMARLAGEELAIKRLAGALDSKDPAVLTSRFSGNSYEDFVFAVRGIRNVWSGDFGDETQPGLETLIQKIDPTLSQHILHAINHAEAAVAALETPLERETLTAAPNAPARQTAERAIADLKRLAGLLRDAGTKLGVSVYLPN